MTNKLSRDYAYTINGQPVAVRLTLDLDALAQRLALRVARGKSGKAVTAGGSVTMRRTNPTNGS